jgi:hypothetical protein
MRSRSASSTERAGLLLLALASSVACPARAPSSALVVLADPGDHDADVYVDGNYVGQVGELQNSATGATRLLPGVHRVEVRKPGRFPVQRTVRVDKKPAPETVVDAELLEDPL